MKPESEADRIRNKFSNEDGVDERFDDYMKSIKVDCLAELISSKEMWDKHVKDYGSCMHQDDYDLLDRAARFAAQGDNFHAGLAVRVAWEPYIELAAETLALQRAEQYFDNHER